MYNTLAKHTTIWIFCLTLTLPAQPLGLALPLLPASTTQMTKLSAEQLALLSKAQVSGKSRPTPSSSRVVVGADKTYNAEYNGSGHTAAVIDTGIDLNYAI